MDESYEAEEDDETLENYKPTGQKRVQVIAKADGVQENRHNIEIMLNSLKLLEVSHDF